MIIIGPNHLLCLVYCLFPFTGLENPREQELCISPGSGTVPGNYALDKYLLDGWPNGCFCFTQWNLSNLVFYFSSLCKMLLRRRANGAPSTSSLRTVLTSVVVYKAASWAGKVREPCDPVEPHRALDSNSFRKVFTSNVCVCVCLCIRAHVCACMCEWFISICIYYLKLKRTQFLPRKQGFLGGGFLCVIYRAAVASGAYIFLFSTLLLLSD